MPSSSPLPYDGELALHVEEDHDGVLRHILDGIEANRLSISGNTLLHLDAHPELGLPIDLTDEVVRNKHWIIDAVNSDNWILPCAYLGLINDIIWIHPKWARQIQDGQYQFKIGRHRETGEIKVTCLENYFLGKGMTVHEDDLEDTKPVRLLVAEIHPGISEVINKFLPDSECPIILDICLDFFSSKNPFLDVSPKSSPVAKLRDLYTFEPIIHGLSKDEQIESCRARESCIKELYDIVRYMDQRQPLELYDGIGKTYLDQVKAIQAIIESDYSSWGDMDWLVIHNAGGSWDNTDLPHHISDPWEIRELLRLSVIFFERFLSLNPPGMVTVARSALGDFCPPEQVEAIQSGVVQTIQDLFHDVNVHYHHDPSLNSFGKENDTEPGKLFLSELLISRENNGKKCD